jgi:ribosome-associated heat shock protein Hsp15
LSEEGGIRLDKWLWHARFFKSRSLANRVCVKGRVRIDGQIVRKAHYIVRIGHVLTFPQARQIRVVRVEGLGMRRGAAVEAQALYTEIGADEAS